MYYMETLLSDSAPFVSDSIEVHCTADILHAKCRRQHSCKKGLNSYLMSSFDCLS